MIWVWPNIPCWFLHYLCVGGQGRWVPPGWLSGHPCSESSAFLSFLSTQPTQTPGERQFLNGWWRKDCSSFGQMCEINTRAASQETKYLKLGIGMASSGREWETKIKGGLFEEDRSLLVDLPPTPAPPALNFKKKALFCWTNTIR